MIRKVQLDLHLFQVLPRPDSTVSSRVSILPSAFPYRKRVRALFPFLWLFVHPRNAQTRQQANSGSNKSRPHHHLSGRATATHFCHFGARSCVPVIGEASTLPLLSGSSWLNLDTEFIFTLRHMFGHSPPPLSQTFHIFRWFPPPFLRYISPRPRFLFSGVLPGAIWPLPSPLQVK